MRGGAPHIVAAGQAVVETAAGRGIAARLLGGAAIWLRGTDEARAALGRDYADFDLLAHKRQSRQLRSLLESMGYEPDQLFNAMHGARRLIYHSREPAYHLDVFLDEFEMSHKLELGSRLETEALTLPAADLLLTKLQVAQLNRKDASDVALLLWSHELGTADGPGRLNLAYAARVCAADWGLYTTASDNLQAIATMLSEFSLPEAGRTAVASRLEAVAAALRDEPKSTRWKLRDRVGRRVRWYELPEEVHR